MPALIHAVNRTELNPYAVFQGKVEIWPKKIKGFMGTA